MNKEPENRADKVLQFLQQVTVNNNREWFALHREEYDNARESFESMVASLLPELARLDPDTKWLGVKDCTYRFYRDTRFSPDKSPYKRHMGAYCNAKGKKSYHGGYYLHLELGNCMIAGGAWCLPSPILKAVRESICLNIDDFRQIVEEKHFQKFYPTIGENLLKTNPKGFPKDFPFPQYIRPKDYSIAYQIPDTFFSTTEWLGNTIKAFAVMKPFLDFVNDTIDDYI